MVYSVWANPSLGEMGIIARVAANLETLWPLITVLGLWLPDRTRPRLAP